MAISLLGIDFYFLFRRTVFISLLLRGVVVLLQTIPCREVHSTASTRYCATVREPRGSAVPYQERACICDSRCMAWHQVESVLQKRRERSQPWLENSATYCRIRPNRQNPLFHPWYWEPCWNSSSEKAAERGRQISVPDRVLSLASQHSVLGQMRAALQSSSQEHHKHRSVRQATIMY